MPNRLYRSRYEKVIGGVCGGLGQYLNIDPVLVRLFFVLLLIAGGAGVLIYFLMLIVVPEDPEEAPPDPARTRADIVEYNSNGESQPDAARNAMIIGGFLIVVGMMFLLRNFDVFPFRWFNLGTMWPLLLIVGGGAILWRVYKGEG